MARVTMHIFARRLRDGLIGTSEPGKVQLTAAWGCRPAVIIEACAVSAVRRLADRAVCSVVRES